MASQIIASASEKVKTMTGERTQKVADLTQDTKDVHDKSHRITTDYGVKQNDTDDWLKVVNEDKTGPMLLEDPFAREKVRINSLKPSPMTSDGYRSTGLTTNVSPSVLSMPEAQAPTANSRSSSRPQTSLQPVSSQTLRARRPSSCDSRPCWAAEGPQIPSAMSAASLSSSTPRKAIGISLETTSQSSSFRMQ